MEINCEQLRSVEEIPQPYCNIFSEFPCFNLVQSRVLDEVLYTDNSVVISAPTGSGKTTVFELAIVRILMKYEGTNFLQNFKIIYISPIKALCQEKLNEWHKKFTNFGLSITCVTGDSDKMEFRSLLNYNLIISTPEKWDALTRKWRDNEELVKVVKLFMIDEVHLLNADIRGSTLEVIVSRMKTVEINQQIRFIAASATVPNVEDVAEWIGYSNSKNSDTKYFKFSEDMRPVRLKKIVHGYPFRSQTQTAFKFDLCLNFRLQPLIMQYSEGKPTLIFCNTRKSVEMTAKFLVQHLNINLMPEQKQQLLNVASSLSDRALREILVHGFGFHHAGLLPENRHAIEEAFKQGQLPILVTTSALALGVNLPAHLVIIKNTKQYVPGMGIRDYDEIEVLQMIGRAGRPQYDSSATAIILTTNEDKLKFDKMISCQQPIESNLHKHLTEHLNAEVVLRTITDLDVAMQWLASTFLYIRARKNPHHYNLPVGLSTDQIDKKILEIFQIHLNKLVRAGMLTMDQNIMISPTVCGQIMAKFYVDYETMKLFTQITGKEVITQILGLISKCHEFSEMCLRMSDKKCLNLLNKNAKKQSIRYPLNGKIKTLDMKINCIIQAVLGNLDIYDQSVLCDSIRIMRIGERISKCLIEYLETIPNCYSALLNTIILSKCFHAKLWENSQFISKQLTGIGNVMSHQLANSGKTSFSKILETNPRELEMILKRKTPVGNTLIEEVKYLPQYEMCFEKSGVSDDEAILKIKLKNYNDLNEKSTININSTMILLVGENNNNTILLYEKYTHLYLSQNPHITKTVNLKAVDAEHLEASFISEDWVGIDCNCEIETGRLRERNNCVSTKMIEKKNPTYMQMFLDMYMKSQKKVPQEGTQKEKKNGLKSQTEIKSDRKSTKNDKLAIPVDKNTPSKKIKSKSSSIKVANTLFRKNKCTKTPKPKFNAKNAVEKIEIKNDTSVENEVLHKFSEFTNNNNGKQTEIINDRLISAQTRNEKQLNEVLNMKYDINEGTSGDNISTISEEESNTSLFSDKLSQKNFESEMCKLMDHVQQEFQKQSKQVIHFEDDNQNKENTNGIQFLEKIDKTTKKCFQNPEISSTPRTENNLRNVSSLKEEQILHGNVSLSSSMERLSPIISNNVTTKNNNNDVKEHQKNKTVIDNLSKINLYSIERKYNMGNKININETLATPIKPRKVIPLFPMTPKKSVLPAMDFEDILTQKSNDENRKTSLDKFRFNRKKFFHNVQPPDPTVKIHSGHILVPTKKPRMDITYNHTLNDDSLQKSIKWRSPLVYSPPVKFSPKLSLETIRGAKAEDKNVIQNDNGNETLETLNSASTKTSDRQINRTPLKVNKIRSPWHTFSLSTEKQPTRFPLSDKECNESPKKSLKDISDICSTSFCEEILNSNSGNDGYNKQEYKTSASAGDYYISQPLYKEKDEERNVFTQKDNISAMSCSRDLNMSVKGNPEMPQRTHRNLQNENIEDQINCSQIQDDHATRILRHPFPEASLRFPQNDSRYCQNILPLISENEVGYNSIRCPERQPTRIIPFSQHYRQNVLPASELEFIDDYLPFKNPEQRVLSRYPGDNSYCYPDPRMLLSPPSNRSRYFYRDDSYRRSEIIRPAEFVPNYYNTQPFCNRPMQTPYHKSVRDFEMPYPSRSYNYPEIPGNSNYFRVYDDQMRYSPIYLEETYPKDKETNRSFIDNQENIDPDIYKRNNTTNDVLEYSASQVENYRKLRTPQNYTKNGPVINPLNSNVDISNMMTRNLSFNENEPRMDENKNSFQQRSFEERLNTMFETNNRDVIRFPQKDSRNITHINNRNEQTQLVGKNYSLRKYKDFEEERDMESRYAPQMNYNFDSLGNRNVRPYNDKKYVMNKFLHSFDE